MDRILFLQCFFLWDEYWATMGKVEQLQKPFNVNFLAGGKFIFWETAQMKMRFGHH